MVDCCISNEFDLKGRECTTSCFQKGYQFLKNVGVYKTEVYGKYTGVGCICEERRDLRNCKKLRIANFERVAKSDVREALRYGPLTAALLLNAKLLEFEGYLYTSY